MPGIEDLYREIILDHYRTPRNRGELPPPAVYSEGNNPLCGDDIRIYLDIADGVCLLYTSPSPRDGLLSRMPSSA